MKKIYQAAIEKKISGSVIEHINPAFEGKVIISVSESTTEGDNKVFVVECTEEENSRNLTIAGVTELTKSKAVTLAAKYQPEITITNLDPETMKEEVITIPKCDLTLYLN